MNRQDTFRGEGDNGLMARWLASGGALEALAAIDAAADDGLRAGGWSGHAVFCADDGLQGGRMTTHPFACADDGLRCSQITRGYGCIPPSVDDSLRAGNATGPACEFHGGPSRIPTAVDDGLRACSNTPICPGAI